MNCKTPCALLVLVVVALSGCATLSESECREGVWYAAGFEDGSKGLFAANQLKKHTKSCSRHNIKIDNKTYELGHESGIKTYCTPANARKHALNRIDSNYGNDIRRSSLTKHSYNGICPQPLELAYLQSYLSGLHERLEKLNAMLPDAEKAARERYESYFTIKKDHQNKTKVLEGSVNHIKLIDNEIFDQVLTDEKRSAVHEKYRLLEIEIDQSKTNLDEAKNGLRRAEGLVKYIKRDITHTNAYIDEWKSRAKN